MYGLIHRVYRLIDDFSLFLYKETGTELHIEKRDGKINFPCRISEIKDGYEVFQNGDFFAHNQYDRYALFRFEVDIPMSTKGEELFLRIATNQDGHNMIKPQALLYVDDEALQGLDVNHTYVNVTKYAGQRKIFYVYGFNGRAVKTPYGAFTDLNTETGVKVFFSLQTRDVESADLYYNLKTAYDHLAFLAEGSMEYQKILYSLSDTLSLLDLREPNSNAYYESVKKANVFIKEALYSQSYEGNGEIPPTRIPFRLRCSHRHFHEPFYKHTTKSRPSLFCL